MSDKPELPDRFADWHGEKVIAVYTADQLRAYGAACAAAAMERAAQIAESDEFYTGITQHRIAAAIRAENATVVAQATKEPCS
jgi:hypothetical protein